MAGVTPTRMVYTSLLYNASMSLYQDEIAAIYADTTWPNHLKPGVLAWSIAEQGRGVGPLYFVHNCHSLHWRDELKAYYPYYYLLPNTTEKDNKYFSFASFAQEIEALHRFIHRSVYGAVDQHMGSIKELLTFITPAFCPRIGYVDYVLSLLPEATAELTKVGWRPDMTPVPAPVPVPAPAPTPAPGELFVTAGILTGPNVKYWWVKNHDLSDRPRTAGIILHEPDARSAGNEDRGLGIIYDWSIKTTYKSAHALICEDGTIIQTVNFLKPAWHCVGQNDKTLGFELACIGAFWSWMEFFGYFYRFKNALWQQRIAKADCMLYKSMYWPKNPYTPAQYTALRSLIAACRACPQFDPKLWVSGHSAFDAQRVDPGPFDWSQIITN